MSTATPFVTCPLLGTGVPPCNPDEFLIVRENFSGAGSGGFNDYWNDELIHAPSYSPNTAEIPFPTAASKSVTAPSGNTYIGNYFYRATQTSDATPLQASQVGETFTERYVRWNEYYQPGFLWPQSQKLARIGNGSGDGPTIDFIIVTNPGTPITQALTVLGYDAPATEMFGGTNCPISPIIALGTWLELDFYFRKATAANATDGRFIARINGHVVCDRNNVKTHDSDVYPYNFLWVGGNNTWNGNGPGGYTTVPQNQNRYIDNIEVFSALPCDVTLP